MEIIYSEEAQVILNIGRNQEIRLYKRKFSNCLML
jgi:hypothetical protein